VEDKSIIPFRTIFQPAGAYTSSKRQFWLPGTEVKAQIIDFKRQEVKIMNPNL
jgi:hypothetical protein